MKPSRHPQNISKTAWYYENPRSISVLVEARDANGHHLKTTEVRIPWSRLLKTAKRCGIITP